MSEQSNVSSMNNWFAGPQEQFEEMRDTWLASMAKWAEFAKDPLHGKVLTPEELREMFSPASWTAPGKGRSTLP
jgi:hypothetical protein